MSQERQLFTIHHWRQYGASICDEWKSSHADINQEFISRIENITNNLIEQDDVESVEKLNNLRKEIPSNIWRKYANKISKEKGRLNKSLISDFSTEKLSELATLLHTPNKSKKELIEYALNIAVALLQNKLISVNTITNEDIDDDSLEIGDYASPEHEKQYLLIGNDVNDKFTFDE